MYKSDLEFKMIVENYLLPPIPELLLDTLREGYEELASQIVYSVICDATDDDLWVIYNEIFSDGADWANHTLLTNGYGTEDAIHDLVTITMSYAQQYSALYGNLLNWPTGYMLEGVSVRQIGRTSFLIKIELEKQGDLEEYSNPRIYENENTNNRPTQLLHSPIRPY